ncbi:zinc-dependent alcohol dehydrogenase family protein [Aquicella lusitana]|uniref:NADPH2:quinone reductase n=1 Tax=Aquicella lusitana TaxID=254246 RepID=A0A370G0J8_9COXI|nr:zinc-dependent alcohol dehydrogenase family protein [Aquicella lusitana]RDI37278.1 NADPH2:quinone reductase [Aquicella lusitana]VVC73641.1 2-haloacrylate reductase [Aquicella lusitana]
MKAQVIKAFGDPGVFETMDMPVPMLLPGHVLVRVAATSINPLDYKIRSGKYQASAPPFPAVLHGDVAGIVEAVGPDVTTFQVGDEVFGCAGGIMGSHGALAELMLADARLLAKKPKSLSLTQAAALPLVSITAWEGLFDKIKIQPGQKILIHAGTGGVGHAAIQLAKWAGADVYTTVSSPDKAKIAKSLGATETIDYRHESVEDYVKRLTGGKGFEVVFDTVGGENLERSMAAISLYGNVITAQANSTNNLSLLHAKSGSLHAVFILIPLLYNIQRERHGMIMTKLAELVDQGKLKPLIDPHTFTFDEIGKAHALLESGKAIGKIVVSRE